MTTILAFAFVLGVLVFVHELGHFLAAKRVGIRVLKFQLGFNPTVLSFRRGDTEYGVGALPLGGYVKMAGDNPEEANAGRPDEFLSKTKWERFQVLIAGPAMNLVLAVVLTALVLYQGIDQLSFLTQPVVIGAIKADSPAAASDIRVGDRIVAVQNRDVSSWEQFFLQVSQRPNRETSIRLVRNGTELTRKVTPNVAAGDSRFEIGEIGVMPTVHPHVRTVQSGGAAEKAGLKPNDQVVAIDGQTITFGAELKDAIASHPDQQISMSILRDGKPMTILATPVKTGSQGLLGISIGDDVVSMQPTAAGAVVESVKRNLEYGREIFRTVWGLLTRETSPKQLMGPVAIAQMSGESAQLGWIALFSLMASLSLNLGILNLLPIPVLDGGHIFIMTLEGVARRDFSNRVKEKMLLAGFVALMMLMTAVIYNDLTRITWIERLMPWR
jgi:regulator of sigma E protease